MVLQALDSDYPLRALRRNRLRETTALYCRDTIFFRSTVAKVHDP